MGQTMAAAVVVVIMAVAQAVLKAVAAAGLHTQVQPLFLHPALSIPRAIIPQALASAILMCLLPAAV